MRYARRWCVNRNINLQSVTLITRKSGILFLNRYYLSGQKGEQLWLNIKYSPIHVVT